MLFYLLSFFILILNAGIFAEDKQYPVVQPVAVTSNVFEAPDLEKKLQEYVKPSEHNTVGYIMIGDRSTAISDATWLYVKMALDHYRKTKPAFIILELNTPGGEVFAAEKISDALMSFDIQESIPVIAFINNWAMSAGAMLAYSCRFIAITKDASMGAAEPITAGASGEMQTASEKVNSALRADFANRANFFGRDPDIAVAMVDKDVILVVREGKILRLNGENQIQTTDEVISPKGKLLTLTADQMMRFSVADVMMFPTKIEAISEAEKHAGKWPFDKMLLHQVPFFNKLENAAVDEYQMDWKTRFFVILASPVVSSILMLGLMLGFYVEISTPGFGVAGTIGLLSFFLIALSYLSLDIANWLEVILLVSGILVIVVDLFVLPTFGFLGFIGIVLALAGLLGIMLPGLSSVKFDFDTNTMNAAGVAVLERLTWLCGTLLLGFLLILFIARYVSPSMAAWSRLVLAGGEQDADKGYIAGVSTSDLPTVGTKGKAISTMRPAGKIVINDNIYDAISSGTFIEEGASIIVSQLDGSVIVVEEDRS